MSLTRYENDTIAAVSTPFGKGGIAVIKLSGPDSVRLLKIIFSSSSDPEKNIRKMIYGHIKENSQTIDNVLACYMKAPHSYTGEDVVEIQSHGGYAAAEAILGLLLRNGARPAEHGEFTKRAFLNNKIDLAQAEAIMEIVSADNIEHLKSAENIHSGELSKKIENLINEINTCLSFIEFNIDFNDHGIDAVKKEEIKKSLQNAHKIIKEMVLSYKTAKRIKHGINIVITGKVNAGKSSLFNKLLGKKRAIVNSNPGTTRDWLEEKIEIEEIPINLIDTAGIRFSNDEIEKEGVSETERLLKEADIVIHLTEITETHKKPLKKTGKCIYILSKADISEDRDEKEFIYISSETGEGIGALITEIVKKAKNLLKSGSKGQPIIIDRHRNELKLAEENISRALTNIETMSEEFIAFEIKEAIKHLQAIIGKNIEIAVLDKIFNNFCIGK